MRKLKVLIADPIHQIGKILLRKIPNVEFLDEPDLHGDLLKQRIIEMDPSILVVRATKVTHSIVENAKSLKLIVRGGSGLDSLDVEAIKSKNIEIKTCVGKNAAAVAELFFGLLISLDRHLFPAINSVNQGNWTKVKYSNGKGLAGRTLGILGFGFVGKEIALRAQAFGMNVLVNRKRKTIEGPYELVENYESVFSRSDFVCLCLESNSETNGLINKETLRLFKKDAILINVARGAIIEENDLLEHLKENPNFKVGIDTVRNEPSGDNNCFTHPFANHPQILFCPHIGAGTDQAQEEVAKEIAKIVLEFSSNHFQNVKPSL